MIQIAIHSGQRAVNYLKASRHLRQLLPSVCLPPTSCLSFEVITGTNQSYRQYCVSFAKQKDLPYHLVVGLPALSPTMDAGALAEWYVKEGDSFSAGDGIAKIETDKAAMDFEAQDDGFVAKIIMPAGQGNDSKLILLCFPIRSRHFFISCK